MTRQGVGWCSVRTGSEARLVQAIPRRALTDDFRVTGMKRQSMVLVAVGWSCDARHMRQGKETAGKGR